jgi:hypothetical protein
MPTENINNDLLTAAQGISILPTDRIVTRILVDGLFNP